MPDVIELVYASRYQVSIPCVKYRPTLTGVAVIRAKNFQVRERDPFPRFTTLALQAAQQMLTASEGQLSVRQVSVISGYASLLV